MLEEEKEQFKWTQWQAIQLGSLRQYRREYSDVVQVAFEEIVPEAEKQIERAYRNAATEYGQTQAEAYRSMGKPIPHKYLPAYKPDPSLQVSMKVEPKVTALGPIRVDAEISSPGDDSFFQINKPKLEVMITDVRRDMDVARYGAAQRMGSIHEEITRKADMYFQTGTMTLNQAVDLAAKEAAETGLDCVEYSDGRRVNVSTYVEMALRTSSRRAALTAEGAKRDEFGEFLVISPTLHSTCDTCQIWQGKVLIDDVFASGKPDGKHPMLSTAIAPPSHFLGPNCRHPLATYYEGYTEIPKSSPYDKTKENYQAEQRQRQIELMIRKYKRQKESAIEPEMIDKYTNKIREWQGKMLDHLEENPQLRRKPEREIITEFMLAEHASA